MKKGEIYIRFSLVLAAILCFAGIGGAKNVEANPAKIKVGVVLPLTGPPASMGIGGRKALEVFFDYVNETGY